MSPARRCAVGRGRAGARRCAAPGRSIALVGEELAVEHDDDAVAVGVRLARDVHGEVDGAHDPVAELLLDQALDGGPVDLDQFVEAVDEGVGGDGLSEAAAVGRHGQPLGFLVREVEDGGGGLRLGFVHGHLAEQRAGRPLLGIAHFLGDFGPGQALGQLGGDDLFGDFGSVHGVLSLRSRLSGGDGLDERRFLEHGRGRARVLGGGGDHGRVHGVVVRRGQLVLELLGPVDQEVQQVVAHRVVVRRGGACRCGCAPGAACCRRSRRPWRWARWSSARSCPRAGCASSMSWVIMNDGLAGGLADGQQSRPAACPGSARRAR